MKKFLILVIINVFLVLSCNSKIKNIEEREASIETKDTTQQVYDIINTFDINPDSFIQGLYYKEDKLIISTGLAGHSSIRSFDLSQKTEESKVSIPTYFCEGIAEINGKIYQLTWQDQVCLVYNASTFAKLSEFHYKGEGWGITSNDKELIMSDGSNIIKFINPDNFRTIKSLEVKDHNDFPVYNLNEIEYINGKIWANVWTFDKIIVIDPENGKVEKEYDMSKLREYIKNAPQADVLNGIAYNPKTKSYYLSGKNWGKIFEVKFNK